MCTEPVKNPTAVDCEYFLEGKCKALAKFPELRELREQNCKNELVDVCCYLCDLKHNCNVSCNILDMANEETRKQGILLPSKEERMEIGYRMLWSGYFIVGIMIIIIGGFICSLPGYWKALEVLSKLCSNPPPIIQEAYHPCARLFILSLPLISLVSGLLLATYGGLRRILKKEQQDEKNSLSAMAKKHE